MSKIVLNKESIEVKHLMKSDSRLACVITHLGALEYSLHNDPYEFLIHEIIEQMLSIKAGNTIFARLVDLCGGKITPQNINLLTEEQIKSTGTSSSKAKYIKNLTNYILSNQLNLDSLQPLSDSEVMKILTSLRGIGSWTANMYLIFVLNRLNILPVEDAAFQQAFCWLYDTTDRSKENIRNYCSQWAPYSSIGARYLYRALDSGLTKSNIKQFLENTNE